MPVQANLIAYQNADFSEVFQFVDAGTGEPHDFTGSTFEMDIKETGAGTVVLAATLGVTDIDDGKVTIGFLDGTIAVGSYVYDLIRITGSARELLMFGTMTIKQGVTQP